MREILSRFNLISAATSAAQRALGLLLPPICASCEVPLHFTEPLGLCPDCWRQLPRWDTQTVPTPRLPLHIDNFQAPFLYEGLARDLILQFKFADKSEFAPMLAAFLQAPLQRLITAQGLANPLLMPVPLHPSRLQWRFYNQSGLLAQELGKLARQEVNVTTALIKQVATKAQAQKSAAARKRLPHNTFLAREALVAERNIVLIDDIFTTGSTLNAAAAQLKKAGATSVHALTLAYTQP